MSEPRKLHIKSYGCQMNVYDSHRMADMLSPLGYAETDRAEDADVVVLNTCHIREKAAEKIYSELGRIRALKDTAAREGRRMLIAVAGCVAQAQGEEVLRRSRIVDVVVGPQNYHRLPDLLDRAERVGPVVDTEFPIEDKFDHLSPANATATRKRGITAFVTVQEGCDKFCTFCVVPYTRGVEVSRPAAKILREVEQLAASGVREVTLLGQNVNAYHGVGPDGATWSLARLLRATTEIPGIARVRYTTSHPRDMSDDLIAAHRDLPALMPHLHLPVQSGSDRMLAAMNRKHTRSDYIRTVERLRKAQPRIALSSDFIVGFPSETESDFRDTIRVVEEVGYAGAFSFKYSARPGTPAANMAEQIPDAVKSERLVRLQNAIETQRIAFNRRCAGLHLDLLLEKQGRLAGQLIGRSPYLQPVLVMGPTSMIGHIVNVRIAETDMNNLIGARNDAPHARTPFEPNLLGA